MGFRVHSYEFRELGACLWFRVRDTDFVQVSIENGNRSCLRVGDVRGSLSLSEGLRPRYCTFRHVPWKFQTLARFLVVQPAQPHEP